MCSCNKSGVRSTNCSNITVANYEAYLAKYQCVVAGNLFTQVGLDETDVNVQIGLLTTGITLKTENPGSCAYRDNENKWRTDMNHIIMNSDC